MGCDIHVCVEKKINGRWVMLNAPGWKSPCEERTYKRFAALAGVRGDGPKPRGIPKNASVATRFWLDKRADHSHSWLTMNDACKVFCETGFKPLSEWAKAYPAHYFFEIYDTEDPKDYRIVFGFDS